MGQGNDEETELFYIKDQWAAVRGSDGISDKAYLLSNAERAAVTRVQLLRWILAEAEPYC